MYANFQSNLFVQAAPTRGQPKAFDCRVCPYSEGQQCWGSRKMDSHHFLPGLTSCSLLVTHTHQPKPLNGSQGLRKGPPFSSSFPNSLSSNPISWPCCLVYDMQVSIQILIAVEWYDCSPVKNTVAGEIWYVFFPEEVTIMLWYGEYKYVQVKRVAEAEPEDSCVVHGVVMRKNLTHRKMRRKIDNARVLMLGGSFEFPRTQSRLASFDTYTKDQVLRLKILSRL